MKIFDVFGGVCSIYLKIVEAFGFYEQSLP